ncbi:MAG: NapC/NirT family cytochrome c [Actinobacteria bacterium]|nr:NapC/NirT family cytochrome c [Actinomycetota bacterium]
MKDLIKGVFTFRVIALIAVVAVVGLIAYAALGGGGRISIKGTVGPKGSAEVAQKTQKPLAPQAPPAPLTDPQNIFYLGDQQQSGCLVCHGDTKLTKIVDGKPKSFYVDVNDLKASPHKNVACTSCHKDFGPTSHVQKSTDWKEAASLACIRCHEHNNQYIDYSKGIHGQLALQAKAGKGGVKAPACGDCHSGHIIKKLKGNPEGKAQLRANAQKVCGDCHDDYWQSYDDYYHGRALKSGATDAPTCWDCHGYHGVQPKASADSLISEANLPRTCDKCHAGSSTAFVEYAKMIHNMKGVRESNPVYSNLQKVLGTINGAISGLFGKSGGESSGPK